MLRHSLLVPDRYFDIPDMRDLFYGWLISICLQFDYVNYNRLHICLPLDFVFHNVRSTLL